MAEYFGSAGTSHLFVNGTLGAVIDSTFNVVTDLDDASALIASLDWNTDGVASAGQVELARAALSTLDISITASAGRKYTIPKNVQAEAERALDWSTEQVFGTPVGHRTAALLASGGQVDLLHLRHLSAHFRKHASDSRGTGWRPSDESFPSKARAEHALWGGDAARKWAASVIEAENENALTADGFGIVPITEMEPINLPELGDFERALDYDDESVPEFIARVRLDGSGIDRLYRVSPDRQVSVWDDGSWDDLGSLDHDIWTLDKALDDIYDNVEKVHVAIDVDAAIVIAARMAEDPFDLVSIEDIEGDEARLAADAMSEIDWTMIDRTLTAAGAVSGGSEKDGVYSPEERSQNASSQVRDKTGKFAKMGSTVMIGGNPANRGKITGIDGASGNVTVEMPNGNTQQVPGKSVEAIDPNTPVPIPSQVPAEPINTEGILAEPRTPINHVGAQIPGTLPQMSKADLHQLLADWPAFVDRTRQGFKPLEKPSAKQLEEQRQPLLQLWANRLRLSQQDPVILASGAEDKPAEKKDEPKAAEKPAEKPAEKAPVKAEEKAAPAAKPATAMTPENSDVQPVYLAVVSPDDPQAVLDLTSIVPASSASNEPMTYTRQKGQWVRDPDMLTDLKSATPPPVVPLDESVLNDVLKQVDASEDDETPQTAVAASGAGRISLDFALTVMWGQDIAALIAAGGADRNKGGAEKLRRYWTVGPGGAKIRWNTPGDWTRCVRHLGKFLGPRAKGYCQLRHKEMTGMFTGDKIHLKRDGHRRFSSASLRSAEMVIEQSMLFAHREVARERMGLVAAAPITAGGARFRIPVVIPEGVESGDGRVLAPNATEVRDLPLPLLWQIKTSDGHIGSVVVGRIDKMQRVKGGIGNAEGVFDTGIWGKEAERLVRHKFLRGVSADMDNFEGHEDGAEETEAAAEIPGEERPDVIKQKRFIINKARIMGVTIVAKPAFQECQIIIEDSEGPEEAPVIPDGIYVDDVDPLEAASLVSSGMIAQAIPVVPPQTWFDNPKLNKATPITVEDDGRVFGHIAAWHQDHIGMFNTRPPRSRSNYAYFHSGVIRTDTGKDIPVGQLTLAGGHADLTFNANDTIKHYDDTASAVADVHAGEDAHGIWVAGALRPGISPEQVRALRASAPSGDWRQIKGKLELVAVCQVNVPGFPIARAFVASGQVYSLAAAGASTMAKLRHDPLKELTNRLARLEAVASAPELEARAAAAKAAFASEFSARDQEIADRAAEARAKFQSLSADFSEPHVVVADGAAETVVPLGDLDLDDALASFASRIDAARAKTGMGGVADSDGRVKYTPKTQPRTDNGQFRQILARLKADLGTSGNQGVVNEIKQAEALEYAGDYEKAAQKAVELLGTIDRIETGAMDPTKVESIRLGTTQLASSIAHLPLPFNDQVQKVRFSDLPPVLRQLMTALMGKVETKLAPDDAEKALAEVKDFMRGGAVVSQSDIDRVMNKMLHILV